MIILQHGSSQRFRWRHDDINLIGRAQVPLPVRAASYTLNRSAPRPFYVEPSPDPGIDWSFEYKDSPARLRLTGAGDFNVEIPVDHEQLRSGENIVRLTVTDARGASHVADLTVAWDPTPVPLPLELGDLTGATDIQAVGQVVDGAFDVDPHLGVIRTRGRVKPDSLLLLGSPHGSQEATYTFRYTDGSHSKYIGLSDFFVRHEVEDSRLPIKPGWSTAGLATIRPRGEFAWEARVWIAAADRPGWRPTAPDDDSNRREFSVVRTDPPAFLHPEPDVSYRVRHQTLIDDGHDQARFKIWRVDSPEPDEWLCDETSTAHWHTSASFGLFMHSGVPSEWWDIQLRALD